MTQTIEQLQARVAELEAENMKWKLATMKNAECIRDQHKHFAEYELKISQLRNFIIGNSMHSDSCDCLCLDDDGKHMACSCGLTDALAHQSNTSALDAYVAEKVKEYQKHNGILGREVKDLTRQRDLAVEALERADSFIRNGIDLGFIRMPDRDCPDPAHETPRIVSDALSTIKESEGK